MTGQPDDDRGEVRRAYVVRGRVQGVGFRWSTTRRARKLGLRGTVRNRPDGAVEVHVAGPLQAVQRLRSWLGEGPRSARVEEVSESDPEERLPEGFEIVR